MSWIGTTDLLKARFNLSGLGPVQAPPRPEEPFEILPQGTLLLETRISGARRGPAELLVYDRFKHWRRRFAVTMDEAGRLNLELVQGEQGSRIALDLPELPAESDLRILYSWDAPARKARLSAECVASGRRFHTRATDPLPLPVIDARAMLRNGGATQITAETVFLAISDATEPSGLPLGFTAGTLIDTPDGPRPVDKLRRGDRVTSARYGAQKLRWVLKRDLPAYGSCRPVLLRAPYFGLTGDLAVAADHRLLIGGSAAEYLFGKEEVLVAAGDLVDGTIAWRQSDARLVSYYHLLLDHHDLVRHSGVWGESLYLPPVPERAERIALGIGDIPPSALPRHRPVALQNLSPLEARTLAMSLSA